MVLTSFSLVRSAQRILTNLSAVASVFSDTMLLSRLSKAGRQNPCAGTASQAPGIGRADDQVLVEQEQAVLDRAQNVGGLLPSLAQAAFLPLPRAQQDRHQQHQRERDDQARDHHQSELGRRPQIGRLQLGRDGVEFAVQQRQGMAAGAQRRIDVALQFPAAVVQKGAGGLIVSDTERPDMSSTGFSTTSSRAQASSRGRGVIAGHGCPGRAGVGHEREPADGPRRGHLVQRRVELGCSRRATDPATPARSRGRPGVHGWNPEPRG